MVRQSTQPSAEFLIVPRFAGEVKMDENGQELEPEQDISRKKIRNNEDRFSAETKEILAHGAYLSKIKPNT